MWNNAHPKPWRSLASHHHLWYDLQASKYQLYVLDNTIRSEVRTYYTTDVVSDHDVDEMDTAVYSELTFYQCHANAEDETNLMSRAIWKISSSCLFRRKESSGGGSLQPRASFSFFNNSAAMY
jgi:hypothetical protein